MVQADTPSPPPAHDPHQEWEPVAIVGIGCRFPGARGPRELWRLLWEGRDATGDIPQDRFDAAALYDPRPGAAGRLISRRGGYLDEVDRFDAPFFHISPREAARLDPQQRLLMEVAWEAFEDAGLLPAEVAGTRTGVYLGLLYTDYEDLLFSDLLDLDVYALLGGYRSAAAGRLSFTYDLKGPNVVLDGACASSLITIHLACRGLHTGDCGMALAGGVNLILEPHASIGFSVSGMLAPDGRCKAFSAEADGFVRSDGVGLLVLKTLRDALADGDPIHAVIRGTATNNDGSVGGLLMTPNSAGHQDVIRLACSAAGVEPDSIDYVEAHGTGTKVGDPVETEALATAFDAGERERPLWIGSVKSNLGHTEGAAGVAGVIKAALGLSYGRLPASLHCASPNPAIAWEDVNLRVWSESADWPRGNGPARAGVSALGIVGMNAHAVLEEPPRREPARSSGDTAVHLLPISAHDPDVLTEMARRYRRWLDGDEETGAGDELPALADVCFTAARHRTHQPHRLVVAGRSTAEMVERLDRFLAGEPTAGVVTGRAPAELAGPAKVVFVFPGQGSQWWGMGRRLMEEEPVFRQALERCEPVIEAETGWSLLDVLAADQDDPRLERIDVIQPCLFAVGVALAELWRSWGVEPDAVLGHSMGEVGAACVSGVLSLEDAAKVICRRSRLLRSTSGRGEMALVELGLEQAREALAGREDRVSVAVNNSPTTTVLSGEPEALGEILEELEDREVFCRRIKVDVASHSPQMDPLREPLAQELESLEPRAGQVPVYSTVRSRPLSGEEMDASYWMDNLRQPVLFSTTVERLVADGHSIFIEMSPHPLLVAAVQEQLGAVEGPAVALGAMRREEDNPLLLRAGLGDLHARGWPVDWQRLYPEGRRVRLPLYTWKRRRYWLDGSESGPAWPRSAGIDFREAAAHPLLRRRLSLGHSPGQDVWEGRLSLRSLPWVADHRVQGTVVLPGTAYLEAILAAVLESGEAGAGGNGWGGGAVVLEETEFHNALFVPDQGEVTMQLALEPESSGSRRFTLHSRSGSEGGWSLHVRGRLHRDPEPGPARLDRQAVLGRCPEAIGRDAFYERFAGLGNQWQGVFQGIRELHAGDGEVLARVEAPEELRPELGRYRFHPALFDACGQALAAAHVPGEEQGQEAAFVLGGVGRLRFDRPAEGPLWSHVECARRSADSLVGDIRVYDDEGRQVALFEELRLHYLDAGQEEAELPKDMEEWLYQVDWEEVPMPAEEPGGGRWWILADRQGVGASVADRLRAGGAECELLEVGDGGQAALARLRRHLTHTSTEELAGVVNLWALDAPTVGAEAGPETVEEVQRLLCGSVLELVQALPPDSPPRLWLVTRGAEAPPGRDGSPGALQAPLWGLGRVVQQESPQLRCTLVDLDPDDGEPSAALSSMLSGAVGEDQLARGGDRWFAARLRSAEPAEGSNGIRPGDQVGRFRLTTREAGHLGYLHLAEMPPRPPGAGEVEIEVEALGLNFRDVLEALGVYPQLHGAATFGFECVGRVSAVGDGVDRFAVGDAVMAVSKGTFASHAVVPQDLVTHRPTNLDSAAAATLPAAFLTAVHAFDLARLGAGERVLIHSASGGLGLAAIEVARSVGAEILATAGNEEKREFLRSRGIRHVFDSRSLEFGRQVMEATAGEGVDVVLNSLSGDAVDVGLGVLRPYGRFVEVGKRDIFDDRPIPLGFFADNRSYHAVDLVHMTEHRPEQVRELLERIRRRVEEGVYQPLHHRSIPVARFQETFRHMANAQHVGRLIFTFSDLEETEVHCASGPRLDSRATYLVTGGLGDLGLEVARWLADRGARHLLLISRSGMPPREEWEGAEEGSPLAHRAERLRSLKARGVQVTTAAVDVADAQAMEGRFADRRRAGHPIAGLVHAAGVVRFQPLGELGVEELLDVLRPKVVGAWNLDRLARRFELDFAVFFASASGVLSSPLLGPYAAANCFLDALARQRSAEGLPGLSIDWGFWSEVGMAARQERSEGRRFAPRGMGSFAPDEGLEVMGRLMDRSAAQMVVMPADWEAWSRAYPAFSGAPLLRDLIKASPGAGTGKQAGGDGVGLRDLPPAERRSHLVAYLRQQVGTVLELTSEELDDDRPLKSYGLDSLMAVELKNRLQGDLGAAVPVVRLLKGASIASLLEEVGEELGDGGAEASEPTAASAGGDEVRAEDVDDLSVEALDELLTDLTSSDDSGREVGG